MHPTRIFKTPDELYEAFKAYKKDLDEKSKEWLKVQYVGKEGDRVTDAYKLPYTLEGFFRYCYDNHGVVEQYFKNQDALYEEFIPICSRIKNEIRENQILGGLIGIYNPSITQRLNGLVEKSQVDVREQPLFPDENSNSHKTE